ncbi:unnamed protein product [Ostreobium quekettii]|uniref:F-box domain-containing protein n=1 Tax=Ostreobium quekettii TaxID=121088 RepID=A0A8S1IR38_9CHLO|nr:unnamed protein product [Ostreobium quekettii]
MRQVRRLLEQDMGLEAGMLDADTDARNWISQKVDSMLEGPKCKKAKRKRGEGGAAPTDPHSPTTDPHGGLKDSESSSAAVGLGRLPHDLWSCVFTLLDHEGLATVPQVCKSWRLMSTADALWHHHYYARGFHETSPLRPETAPEESAAQRSPDSQLPVLKRPRTPTPSCETLHLNHGTENCGLWRDKYIAAYQSSCYDCFSPTLRQTIVNAPLRLQLCSDCWSGYEGARPGQRLATKKEAKWAFRLRDADLEGLPYASDVNIVHVNFTSMTLFRRADLRRVALRRWGGEEGFLKELVRSRRI